ncbi:MAG: discoidin domain-containing protein [Pirellulales bacterium]|nr:discoidin domain-containing protein [Pirellulales bacterium]
MKMNERVILCVVACLGLMLGLLAGCDPNLTHGKTLLPNAMSPYTEWKISATGARFNNIQHAMDGFNATYASTRGGYQGASITIDLGRPCMFNMVALLHSDQGMGFARLVALSTSMDGKKFTHEYTAPGTRKVTYLLPMTRITARYVRLTAVRPGSEPWSISEIYFQ